MSTPILSCTGISKTYRRYAVPSVMLQDHVLRWRTHRTNTIQPLLSNVSLELQQGEWIGLYGENGIGKTTLLKILAGLLPADNGTVERHGRMSCFFELGVGFHPERTAEENIYVHGLLHGQSAAEIRRMSDEIIEFAGIGDKRHLPVKCYSTGMQVRLAFAAASHVDSDIYLFDEILAVGDAEFQQICRDHLKLMRQQGKSVIIVNHVLPELRLICDRILFVENGTLVSEEQRMNV